MKYLDFEKRIAAELGGAKENVDMDNLLNALDLGEKPKKKTYPIWIMIPIVLLLGTSIVVGAKSLGALSDTEAISENYNGNENMLSLENSTQGDTEVNTKSTQEDEDVNQRGSLLSNPSKNENRKEKPTKESNIKNESKIASKLNTLNTNSTFEKSQNKTSESQNKQSTQIKTQLNEQNDYIFNAEGNGELVSSSLGDESNSTFVSVNTSTSIETQNSILKSDNSNKRNNLNPNRELEAAIANLERRTLNINPLEAETDIDGIFSKMKINCPSFNQAHWRLALIPEVGVFAPLKSLESKSLDQSPDFEIRNRDERSLEGINFGLYGMVVRDRIPFYLKAGISYSRIAEKLDLDISFTVQDTTIGIISSTVSGNGDTITHVYGPVISERLIERNNKRHYYIHLFDVPVSVGYSTYVAGFDIGIEAGVKFNVLTRGTGNMLVTQAEHANLAVDRLFKERIGLSYFGGLMIGRNFGPFGDFYIAPRFQYYPDDFSSASNNISQKYLAIGINAGVVYKLGK